MKGYGFIRCVGRREDVFVHAHDLKKVTSLREGETVQFQLKLGQKGPRAEQVEVV